jgi:hypothetical protein
MNMEPLLAQLKKLYPKLSDEELVIAKENLDRYLLVAWEIYEDLQKSKTDALTPSSLSPSINSKVDSQTNHP